jgi:hypothetical protein
LMKMGSKVQKLLRTKEKLFGGGKDAGEDKLT